jgi:hypothetical protein
VNANVEELAAPATIKDVDIFKQSEVPFVPDRSPDPLL